MLYNININGKNVEVALELGCNDIWTITWWWAGEPFSRAFGYKPERKDITMLVIDLSTEFSVYDSSATFIPVYDAAIYEWIREAGHHYGLDCLVMHHTCTTIHFKDDSNIYAAYEDIENRLTHLETVCDGETIKIFWI